MSDSVDRVEADRFAAALAAAEPAEYAGLLAALDPGELSHRGRIDLLIALARHRDWLDACEHRVLAALAADQPAPADRDPIGAGLDPHPSIEPKASRRPRPASLTSGRPRSCGRSPRPLLFDHVDDPDAGRRDARG